MTSCRHCGYPVKWCGMCGIWHHNPIDGNPYSQIGLHKVCPDKMNPENWK